MLWLRLLGVIVFLVPLAWTSEARACSCGREPDDRVAFQQARARASTVAGLPRVSGVASGGRAFQLELRRPSQAEAACVHWVLRRWCERLVPGSETEPGLKCVGPSGEASLCDEWSTRRPPR